VACIGDDTSTV